MTDEQGPPLQEGSVYYNPPRTGSSTISGNDPAFAIWKFFQVELRVNSFQRPVVCSTEWGIEVLAREAFMRQHFWVKVRRCLVMLDDESRLIEEMSFLFPWSLLCQFLRECCLTMVSTSYGNFSNLGFKVPKKFQPRLNKFIVHWRGKMEVVGNFFFKVGYSNIVLCDLHDTLLV